MKPSVSPCVRPAGTVPEFLNHPSWSPDTAVKVLTNLVERCVFNTKDNKKDKIKIRIFLKDIQYMSR